METETPRASSLAMPRRAAINTARHMNQKMTSSLPRWAATETNKNEPWSGFSYLGNPSAYKELKQERANSSSRFWQAGLRKEEEENAPASGFPIPKTQAETKKIKIPSQGDSRSNFESSKAAKDGGSWG